jgi:ribulose-phosphate 3-epimerase
MIVEPEKYIRDFATAGADLIIVHQEVCPHLYRTIQQIHDAGARAGVAINPGTPWVMVEEVLNLADLILVMTVNPGFGGQKFIDMSSKIRQIRAVMEDKGASPEIEVDGGISVSTAPLVVQAGARVLVAGTSIFGSPAGVSAAVSELRAAAECAL